MGYYTFYVLTARNIKDEQRYNELVAAMVKMELYATENTDGVFDIGHYYEKDKEAVFDSYDETKWYEHDYDMMKLSKLFPEVTFKLHGEGEEKEDLWNKYFQNGAIEECMATITYPQPIEIEWEE